MPSADLEGDAHTKAVRHIARGGAFNLVGTGVSAVFGFVLTWMVARNTSLTDAGVFFATTSLFLILVAVAEAGGDAALPRFIPLLKVRGRQQEIRDIVRLASILALAVGVVLGVLLLVANGAMNHLLGLQDTGSLDTYVLVSLAVAIPLTALANVLLAATRGFFSIRATVLIDKVGRVLAQLVLVWAAILVGSVGLTIEAWIAPMALAALPAAWSLRTLARSNHPPAEVAGDDLEDDPVEADARPGESLARAYYRYTWPRAVSRLLQMVLQRADVVVVAAILSPSEAAIYAVATRFIVLGQTAAMSLQQVLAPRIAHLIEDDDYPAALQVSTITAAWAILTCWPLYLLSISAGPLLLTILGGPDYVPGWATMCILAVGMLVGAAKAPVDVFLLMSGKSTLSLAIMIVSVATDLVLLFLLTPVWGIEGAAFARTVALILRSLLGVWFVRRFAGATAFGYASLAAMVTTVVPFLVVPWVLDLRDLGVSVQSALVLVLCLAIMAGLAWVFRGPLSLATFRSLARR